MPSPQTNPKRLDKKIRELQELDALSETNERTLEFNQLWRKFAGQDVVLWIEPKGVIDRALKPPGKWVCVTDMLAADLLAFARTRNQVVIEATPEERQAYLDAVAAQTETHNAKIAAAQAAVTQAQVTALLGKAVPVGSGSTPLMPLRPPAARAAAQPSAPGASAPVGDGQDGTAGPAPANGGTIAERLAAAGYRTTAEVAAANPTDLAKIKGIGKAKAAQIIADANEALAAERSEGDGE